MIQGYQIREKLYDRTNSLIYRAVRDKDSLPVIIKILNNKYPTTEQIACFQHEYEIGSSIDSPGVIKVYELAKFGNTECIIMADIEGESLDKIFAESVEINREALARFLELSIKGCAANFG